MRFMQKIFSYILVVFLVVSNIMNATSFNVNAAEIVTESTTLEDVIAGMADFSNLNGVSTSATAAYNILEDGVYYLNCRYSGDYLKNSSSTPVVESGLLSSLGTSIQWKIINMNNSVAIQSVKDSSKYLAVPASSVSSSTVRLVTVGGATIPTECLWNISVAEGGGCLLQNVFNSRYLYTNGTSLSTSSSLGSSGSAAYNKCVWRIGSISYISGKELNQAADFETLVLTVGGTGAPSIIKSPSNAIWATASDFCYSREVTSHVTESNGVFSGNSSGVTTVIATHKVTDLQFVFAVVVGNQPAYTISNYIDQGYRVRFDDLDTIAYNSVVQTKLEQFFGLNTIKQYIMHTSSADTCKIMQFGSVTSGNLTSSCQHSGGHLTGNNLRDQMGSGTNINSRVLWTGHILPGNPSSDSRSDVCSVIITPKHTTTGNNFTNKSDSEVRKESIFTLMHELSHQLGAPDHYCYGINPGESVCGNRNCDICYMGKTKARNCMMSYRYNIETESERTLYCSSCLSDISNHLSGHHQ